MTFSHGKHTIVKLGANDLSQYANATTFNRSLDAADVTTYGKNSKVYRGSLKDSKITLEGFYDTSATGPGAVIRPLLDLEEPTTFTFQPEGAGTGKPQAVVDVVVTAYNESAPVAEYITWTCELQGSDDIVDTPQA